MEQSRWLSVVTPSHNTVGKYIPFPALWLGVLDLGGRQTRAQITALLLTSYMTFGKWPSFSLNILISKAETTSNHIIGL